MISLPPVPLAQNGLRSMQMCAVDKDVKREDAVDAVLLSICTQHWLRLDFQSDLKGGAEEMNLWKDWSGIVFRNDVV